MVIFQTAGLHSMSAALFSIFSAIGASRSVGGSREFSPTVNRSHSSLGDRPREEFPTFE